MKEAIKKTMDFFKSKYNYHQAVKKNKELSTEGAISTEELEVMCQKKAFEARFEEVREMLKIEKKEVTLNKYLSIFNVVMTGTQVGLLTRDFEVCSEYWTVLLENGLGK